jgi:hypothetical protein
VGRIVFDFGAHQTAQDAQRLCCRLAKADIVVMEMVAVDPQIYEGYNILLNEVAAGSSKAYREIKRYGISDYEVELAKFLLKDAPQRSKPLRIVLEPYSGKASAFYETEGRMVSDAQTAFGKGDIGLYFKKMRAYISTFVRENIGREKTLAGLIRALWKGNPKANMLVELGASHGPVYTELKRSGLPVKRNIHRLVRTSSEELVRRRMAEKLGLKKPMGRAAENRLLLKIAVANTLTAMLSNIPDSIERLNTSSRIVERLSRKDLEDLLKDIKKRKGRLAPFVLRWLAENKKLRKAEARLLRA